MEETPVIVVGIDPSLTSCGIAVLVDAQPKALRSIGHGTPDGKTYGHRSDRIVSQCRAIIGLLTDSTDFYGAPHLAVIEGPSYGSNLPSNHDRAGLWWGLFSTLRARRIPIAVVAPGTRAKWATGHGRAEKPAVLAAVRAWWPDHRIPNHDTADAAILAAMGAMHLGDTMPFHVKDRHHAGLQAVQWPSKLVTKPETPQVGAPR